MRLRIFLFLYENSHFITFGVCLFVLFEDFTFRVLFEFFPLGFCLWQRRWCLIGRQCKIHFKIVFYIVSAWSLHYLFIWKCNFHGLYVWNLNLNIEVFLKLDLLANRGFEWVLHCIVAFSCIVSSWGRWWSSKKLRLRQHNGDNGDIHGVNCQISIWKI